MPQFDVFLSHNSIDKPWARQLKADLGRYGVSAWLDEDEIRPGALIVDALELALEQSRATALIISPEAMASGWVKEEYTRAVTLAQDRQRRLQLIPVILRGVKLPGFLTARNWVDFRDEVTYDQNIWQLVWGITGQKPPQILDLSTSALPSPVAISPISQTKRLVTSPATTSDVFLSYNHTDQSWVNKLKDNLHRYGLSVWLDEGALPPSDLFTDALERAWADCRAIAFIISHEAMASGWVREEYVRILALAKEKQFSIQLIPVILQGAALPGFVETRNWVDFRDEVTYDQNIWQLVWGITGQKPPQVLDLSMPALTTPLSTQRETIEQAQIVPIYTFYSYKGGVGRSMALANVAEWLYWRRLRVVMIDWDLEAPGLENYFFSSEEALEVVHAHLGLIDLLLAYKRRFPRLFQLWDRTEPGGFLRILQENLPSIMHALYPIHPPASATGLDQPALWLLPAGWRSEDRFAAYAEAVQSFDWADFYASYQGEVYFEWLRQQLSQLADIVLIDSRTGVTEMGGVCTRQLADVVVSFCAPNIQGLIGVTKMTQSFMRKTLWQARNGRPLEVVVVPTRLESSESNARSRFEEQFNARLAEFTPPAFRRVGQTFWDLRIPYVAKYAYAETLAVGASDGADELTGTYQKLAIHLGLLAPAGSHFQERLAADIAALTPDSRQVTPALFTVPPLPLHLVERPAETERLLAELLADTRAEGGALSITLRGMGGIGKTTLALAIGHHPFIRRSFPDGILWVTLGPEPDLLELLKAQIELLSGEPGNFATLDMASARWRELLAGRRILVILDDVWNEHDALPFMGNSPGCVYLLTTRRREPMPQIRRQVAIDVNEMQTDEARALLINWLDELPVDQQPLRSLAQLLGEWPLLLELAAAYLRGRVKIDGEPLDQAIAGLQQQLAREGFTYLDRTNEGNRNQAIHLSLEMSLERLERWRERYLELAGFPEDVAIPFATIERLWGRTTGLNSEETSQALKAMHNLALFNYYDPINKIIRLHDVVRAYLQAHLADPPALHHQLLEAHRPTTSSLLRSDPQLSGSQLDPTSDLSRITWADLPPDEPYLWDHLAYHLNQAGRGAELVAAVKDLPYLIFKTYLRNTTSVEGDLRMAETYAPDDSTLRLLRLNLANTSHLLNQCAAVGDVISTLCSRIGYLPALAPLVRLAASQLNWAYLTCRHPLPDLPDPMLIRTLTGHIAGVNSCAISTDGRTTVSASADTTLKVWDAHSGAERLTLFGHIEGINSCAISTDGRTIVSASADRTLKVWDAHSGAERLTILGDMTGINSCAISGDGRLIVSASIDNILKVWDAHTGAKHLILSGHTDRITACVISSDGRLIVSASADKTLKVWDTQIGVARLTLVGHNDWVTACALSADRRTVVSASRDGTVKIWDLKQGRERFTLTGHTDWVTACALSANGQIAVSASRDGTVKVWDLKRRRERLTLFGHTDRVNGCALSADGRIAVSASQDGTLKIWDTVSEMKYATLRGHTGRVNGCAISPDGTLLISASSDQSLKIWDAHSGAELRSLTGHRQGVLNCAISPDGRWAVSASSDNTLKVWDMATGAERMTLTGHIDGVSDCAISPDGRFIVSTSGDKTIKIWDAVIGTERLTLAGHTARVNSCALSPDGAWLVSASDDKTLKVWDVADRVERMTLKDHTDWVLDCAVSPDGAMIISTAEDRTIKVWDSQTGQVRLTLEGHQDGVFGCAISPDGKFIISVSSDKTLKVWDAQNGNCLTTLHVDGQLSSCAWFPDGQNIAAVGDRGIYFLRLVSNLIS